MPVPPSATIGVRKSGRGSSSCPPDRRLPRPPLVELEGAEELVDLVRHRVHRVVRKVGARLVRRRRRRRRLPARHVDRGEVRRHHRHLHRVERAVRARVALGRLAVLQRRVQLLRHLRRRVRLLDRAAERDHVAGRVRARRAREARLLPPLLDLGDLVLHRPLRGFLRGAIPRSGGRKIAETAARIFEGLVFKIAGNNGRRARLPRHDAGARHGARAAEGEAR